MSKSFARTHLSNEHVTPTSLTLRTSSRSYQQGLRLVHNIMIQHEDAILTLDFHIFDDVNFSMLIGHPLEKFLIDPPKTGELDVKLGRNTLAIPFTQAKNSRSEPLPYPIQPNEVVSVLPFESPESSLEKDANHFIEEKDDLGETFELPKEEVPTTPQVELKTLPKGLRYAFLNGNKNTPIIISDKLFDEEMAKLIAILEKHRLVFGYSLQDLKGISPTRCTHRIPIDPTSSPSHEPQRRLNNAMREVVKKEVLKLLYAGIIYPVPHSTWVSPVQVVPKKRGMTVVENAKNELIPQRIVTG